MVHDLNIYHEIADTADGFFTDLDAMTPDLFSDTAKDLKQGDVLNIHVNSPGGSVFGAATMTSIIESLKLKGVVVNAYIEGVAASAASFLVMACDNVYAHKSAMMMIHKPMCVAFGNADDLLEQADVLEKIETATCIPQYMSKAKVEESVIREMLKNETWLSAAEMVEFFNIEIVDDGDIIDSIDIEKLKAMNYRNIPQQLLTCEEETEPEAHYYDLLQRRIKSI